MTPHAKDEEAIFAAAIQKTSPEARAAYVEGACAGDESLRRRVEALLKSHLESASFLESPPPGLDDTEIKSLAESTGGIIGTYKLLQQLGEGGMGVVYLAERQHPVKQRVALKIIKHGMDSKKFIARFEAERQALAMMDHPNIARVLDAGCTEGGRPYFVMELVKGIPISQYCDENRLTTRERIELFIQVCQAVHHAHQKGVIHRDVKPSNVLVALYDQKPVPKVIDFGVAKATNQQLTEKTLFTEVGSILGTWEYMSPEQAVLNQLDVDTRTDVYSLGVLLYELLTGETPIDRRRLREAQLMETLRMIREEEPPKPSTRIGSQGKRVTTTAAYRKAQPETLVSEIRGDLDWIVMKALEKERSRRYDSASQLAEDVQRFLQHEPIEARPPSNLYQLKKFYHRNRLLASSVVAVVLALILGLTVALIGVGYATRSFAELNAKMQVLQQVLTDWALNEAFSGDIDDALEVIETAEEAEVRRGLTMTLRGVAYFLDGDPNMAEKTLSGAIHENPKNIMALAALSWVYHHSSQKGRHEECQQRLRTVVNENRGRRTIYEKFFLCLARFVDGSEQQIKNNLDLANDIVRQKDELGVPYVLRGEILTAIGYEKKSIEYFIRALEDLDAANAQLPDSPVVIAAKLYALNGLIELEESHGNDSEQWKRLATQLADALNSGFAGTLAIDHAAGFHYRHGDANVASKLEMESAARVEHGVIRWTADNTGYDKAKIPLEDWRNDTDFVEKQLCLAIALAASYPTAAEREECRKIVRRFLKSDVAPALLAISVDVTSLLGDDTFRDEFIADVIRSRKLDNDFYWYRRVVEYQNGQIDEEELRDMAGPFAPWQSLAYYAIAMRALSKRDSDKAEKFLKLTAETGTVGYWTYHNAKAFLNKLRTDSTWPFGHESGTAAVSQDVADGDQ